MIARLLPAPVRLAARLSADSADTPETRLEKTILIVGSSVGVASSLVWTTFYALLGEPAAAWLTLIGYGGGLAFNTLLYSRTHHYPFYRLSQFALITVIPFLLTVALGGLAASGAVILWAFFAVLGVGSFYNLRTALIWFGLYVILVVAAAMLPAAWLVGGPRPAAETLILFLLNILGVSTLPFLVLRYFVQERNTIAVLLRVEQAKSEGLLLNILPAAIAERLKTEPSTIADSYDAVTILFADVVNFTPLATRITPTAAVDLLNDIFSEFDMLAERYGVEKIKTIGDGYMVAAGVPLPRADHAPAVAAMALEMLAYMQRRAQGDPPRLDLRIGIHSGPVVAGVIGQKKFLYDLWGDTVNTASRMESQGMPGRIQITATTYALIRDEFLCEPRGTIVVRGKGEMVTWYLVGRRTTAEQAA